MENAPHVTSTMLPFSHALSLLASPTATTHLQPPAVTPAAPMLLLTLTLVLVFHFPFHCCYPRSTSEQLNDQFTGKKCLQLIDFFFECTFYPTPFAVIFDGLPSPAGQWPYWKRFVDTSYCDIFLSTAGLAGFIKLQNTTRSKSRHSPFWRLDLFPCVF